MKGPCLDCDERYIGCHSDCPKYLEYRKKLDEENKKIFDAKSKQYNECGRALVQEDRKMAEIKEHEYCLRCGRRLKNVDARISGYGPVCAQKMKTEEIRKFKKLFEKV